VAGTKEADAFERFVDLFERFFAEVRDAEQVFPLAVEQVVYSEHAALFEAIGGANGEADFGTTHLQLFSQVDGVLVSAIQWDACHRAPSLRDGDVLTGLGDRAGIASISAEVYQVSSGARTKLRKKSDKTSRDASMDWRIERSLKLPNGDELSHRGCTVEHEFEMMEQ
jgi:hypothetical protein